MPTAPTRIKLSPHVLYLLPYFFGRACVGGRFRPPGAVAPSRDGNCGRYWGFLSVLGGWFCLGRVETACTAAIGRVILPGEGEMVGDCLKLLLEFGKIALQRRYDPPTTESPSGDEIALW